HRPAAPRGVCRDPRAHGDCTSPPNRRSATAAPPLRELLGRGPIGKRTQVHRVSSPGAGLLGVEDLLRGVADERLAGVPLEQHQHVVGLVRDGVDEGKRLH
ncbi:MAG: hypothetical protein ACK55I_09410, partial [bacterium]